MLLVKTKIGPSLIHGIGLFADELIPSGRVIWRFEPSFDILMSENELQRLPSLMRDKFHSYAYLVGAGVYALPGDDARFFNHSFDPNCDDSPQDITLAIRDIAIGEEMTIDYKVFADDPYIQAKLAEFTKE